VTDDPLGAGDAIGRFDFLHDPERPPRRRRAVIVMLAFVVVAVAVTVGIIITRGGSPPRDRAVAPPPTSDDACRSESRSSLTALGATPQTWAEHHVAAYNPVSGPGTRWNARPALPHFRGHLGAVYNDVRTYRNCVITYYYIQLAGPVPLDNALRRGVRELPRDVDVVRRRSLPRCVQVVLTSPELAAALHERAAYPTSTAPLIELMRRSATDRSTRRVVVTMTLKPTARDLGGCPSV
jgi:hypothetical protein